MLLGKTHWKMQLAMVSQSWNQPNCKFSLLQLYVVWSLWPGSSTKSWNIWWCQGDNPWCCVPRPKRRVVESAAPGDAAKSLWAAGPPGRKSSVLLCIKVCQSLCERLWPHNVRPSGTFVWESWNFKGTGTNEFLVLWHPLYCECQLARLWVCCGAR